MVEILTERTLDAFRRDRLSSTALLKLIETFVWVLLRLGIGVGKSMAVDGLLRDPVLYGHFDLVLYFTQSWDVLNERAIIAGLEPAAVDWMTLDPRPAERCGPYAERWADLEKRGCATLAKATLCRECRRLRPEGKSCSWPKQFSRLRWRHLVFAPDQHLLLNRGLVPFIKFLTKAQRVLVILDEAKLVDASFEVVLRATDLRQLREVIRKLARPKGIPSGIAGRWCSAIDTAIAATSTGLRKLDFDLPPILSRHAFKLQHAGATRFGGSFRYIAFEFALLRWSRPGERWKDPRGDVHFIARPYLGCHLLILSAHLTRAYVEHRLGRGTVTSPFEGTRFVHSGTRIYNLCSLIGADCYFLKNSRQVLDTIAVLIARNVAFGKTTLLVSRKKLKEFCAAHLQKRLARWGIEVRFVTGDYSALPAAPDPRVIPVLHYGVHGVNCFSEYSSAYCLTGFYVPSGELNRRVQEDQPEEERVDLRVVWGPDMIRRVQSPTWAPESSRGEVANLALRTLEVDPVVQAVGRVRCLTKPREVVCFAMHDLTPDLGPVTVVRSLAALRKAMGIPSAAEVDHALEGERVAVLRAQGRTTAEIAAELGVSRRTVFRRAQAGGSAKSPVNILREVFWHSAEAEVGQ